MMTLAKNIVMLLVILLLLAFGIRQQLQINGLNEEIAALEKELSTLSYDNEKKQNELNTPLEDQIEKYAKESGYKDPTAEYFYNDFAG